MPFLKAGYEPGGSAKPFCQEEKTLFHFHPFNYLRQMIGTASFFIIGAFFSPIFWVIWKFSGGRISTRTGQLMVRRVFRFFLWCLRMLRVMRVEVVGIEKLRDLEGTIIVSNHPAILDAVFLLAILPPAACVMRTNLLRNPAMGGSALIAGYVTNDSGPALIRQGIEKIQQGENLLIFPEGTRTLDEPVNPFRGGFAMVAVRARAPVQTILIERRGPHFSKGVSLLSPGPLPFHFTIHCGKLFMPESGESAQQFCRRIETWFRGQLKNAGGSVTLKNDGSF